MSQCNRRTFINQVVVGTSLLAIGRLGLAEEAQKEALSPDDAYAKAMGFVVDTNNANSEKFPKHTPEQSCKSCQLFSGAEGDDLGPCSFFGGRLVPPTGWCRNYKPKGAA
jgi:hypothetical protein